MYIHTTPLELECTKNKWPGYLMKEVIGSNYVKTDKPAAYGISV
jgi:hypothetical protein